MLLPNSTSLVPGFSICWLPWLHVPCMAMSSCPAETSVVCGEKWASHSNSWDCSWEVAGSLCEDYLRAWFSVLWVTTSGPEPAKQAFPCLNKAPVGGGRTSAFPSLRALSPLILKDLLLSLNNLAVFSLTTWSLFPFSSLICTDLITPSDLMTKQETKWMQKVKARSLLGLESFCNPWKATKASLPQN